MAYAAALDDLLPCYMDTREPAKMIAHPMFPVCFEWPVVVAMRSSIQVGELTREEAMRGVHATHELRIARPILPGETVTTRATIVAVESRRAGAFEVMRLDSVDSAGAPVCSSFYGALYRGVPVAGPNKSIAAENPAPASTENNSPPLSTHTVHVGAGLAHIYTECARIYNPIHTDAKVAHAAGLPAIILHGTATLALAVSRLLNASGANPARVRRIAGQFRAMVLLASDITVRELARADSGTGTAISFDVLSAKGESAISRGLLTLD